MADAGSFRNEDPQRQADFYRAAVVILTQQAGGHLVLPTQDFPAGNLMHRERPDGGYEFVFVPDNKN